MIRQQHRYPAFPTSISVGPQTRGLPNTLPLFTPMPQTEVILLHDAQGQTMQITFFKSISCDNAHHNYKTHKHHHMCKNVC